MKSRIIISLLLLHVFSDNSFGKYFTRNELLDEGRRSNDVISKYMMMSRPDYKADPPIKWDSALKWDYYGDFTVDTNQGKDSATLIFLEFLNKVTFDVDWINFYFIIQNYGFQSNEREELKYSYINGQYKYSPDQKSPIGYGDLTDIFWDFDIKFFNIIKINIGGLSSSEKLNNTEYDKRPLTGIKQNADGINIDNDGNLLFLEKKEEYKKSYEWVYGINIYDHFFSSFIYKYGTKEISSSNTFLVYKINNNIGSIAGGHAFYKYWDNDNGIMFQWESIMNYFSAGTEYLLKDKKITNIFVGINQNRFGLKENMFYLNFQLRGNISRTPETIKMNNSEEFSFGGSASLGIQMGNCSTVDTLAWWIPCISYKFKILYNDYDRLKLFRNSLNKLGIGIEMGVTGF